MSKLNRNRYWFIFIAGQLNCKSFRDLRKYLYLRTEHFYNFESESERCTADGSLVPFNKVHERRQFEDIMGSWRGVVKVIFFNLKLQWRDLGVIRSNTMYIYIREVVQRSFLRQGKLKVIISCTRA